MTTSLPTRGQLERTLSQRIQALYRNQTGHRPEEVTCEISDQKITIILENSVTQVEQLLVTQGKEEFVEELHAQVKDAIEPQIQQLIEEIVGIAVVDLLSDTKLKTERTAMIAMLAEAPQTRDRVPNGKPRESTSAG